MKIPISNETGDSKDLEHLWEFSLQKLTDFDGFILELGVAFKLIQSVKEFDPLFILYRNQSTQFFPIHTLLRQVVFL